MVLHKVSFKRFCSLFLNILLGPVPAITEALKKAGLTLNDMDLVEVFYFVTYSFVFNQSFHFNPML